MRTQRELQQETESQKKIIFDLNMKLELIRKQNNELKDQLEESQQRVQELEPLADDNWELRDENQHLKLKIQDMSSDLVELQDENAEILKIQEEGVQNMEKQAAALQEAAEIIVRLETDQAALVQENKDLKGKSPHRQPGPPVRVYSIDDSSRPSTSHFDSDYYSQPASPQVKTSKDSLEADGVSDRAKEFLSMKRESIRSVQDLKKRMSDASIKKTKRKESLPDVPRIPETYQQPRPSSTVNRTPRRTQKTISLSPALAFDPYGSIGTSSGPQTPTRQVDGLRAMFREGLSLDSSPQPSRPSPSNSRSPLETRSLKSSRGSDSITAVPMRRSSRVAPTSRSTEQLHPESESEAETEAGTDRSECASMRPPSILTPEDLTTELDRSTNSQWWRTVNSWGHQGKSVLGSHPSSTTGGASANPSSTQPPSLFNPAENEDQFMARARSLRRRYG